MYTVKVRLRKPARVFTALCDYTDLGREQPCIVRSEKGLEYAVCVMPPEESPSAARDRYPMSIVRRATDHDSITHRQLMDDEARSKRLCFQKIRERKLAMKLVDCEYSFDRKKVTFYFTAEDRVDFRELVRDLAADLKTRIELRHIQVRDEAKMVGGIGTCGRELCCTTWLNEFMPISMKMAKRQNLSLNPGKISGQCGRLMCCLSYENEVYSKTKKAQGSIAPDPEALVALRDKMEDDPNEVMEVVMNATRPSQSRPDRERPKREPTAPVAVLDPAPIEEMEAEDAVEDIDKSEAPELTGQAQSDAASRGPRRKRNRRRHGGGGNTPSAN